MNERGISGMGRNEIIAALDAAIKEHKDLQKRYDAALVTIQENGETIRSLRNERDSYLVNLTSTQERTTQLYNEKIQLKANLRNAEANIRDLTAARDRGEFARHASTCAHPIERRQEFKGRDDFGIDCVVAGWCGACGSIDTGIWNHPG